MTAGRLEVHPSSRTLPEPPRLSSSTARFASPFPSPRRESLSGRSPTQVTSPSSRPTAAAAAAGTHTVAPSASPTSTTASLSSLPAELMLAISAYLYLPPDEFSNAHSRSQDLCALGLAGGRHIQAVVRAVLFRQVGLRNQSEVRFLARRPELAGLVRSLAIQSSTIKHYLPLLLPFMPDLSELILSCKVTLRDLALLEPPRPVSPDDAPLLAPAVPLSASTRADGRTTTMPSPTNLQLEISEPLSARLIETLLRSSLVGKIEDLGISSRFIRAGLMADAVELSEAEIIVFVQSLVRGLPTLRRLILPLAPRDEDSLLGSDTHPDRERRDDEDLPASLPTDLASSSAAVVSHKEGDLRLGPVLSSLAADPSPDTAASSSASDPVLAPLSLGETLQTRFFPPLERLRLGGSVGPALEIERER